MDPLDQTEDRQEGVSPSKTGLEGDHETRTRAQRPDSAGPGPDASCESQRSPGSLRKLREFYTGKSKDKSAQFRSDQSMGERVDFRSDQSMGERVDFRSDQSMGERVDFRSDQSMGEPLKFRSDQSMGHPTESNEGACSDQKSCWRKTCSAL
ncbi:uncharacterized protein V6R79_011120 [Siganus canaliculatus]